ncbi:MAG: sulfatase-like hydrolase/transferase [Planctomycetaceae bacterium]|jgi:N-acetylgalactosamine-6-sulfatase|nr:sulfatase-like hydrolase/transferase [Planctomycetaceae bacterium]
MKKLLMLVLIVSVILFQIADVIHAEEKSVQKETRPNILFLLADDLGWGDLGSYGNQRKRTPNLDKLASQGILFTQFYQGGSVCSPSRATLLTSRFPAELKIHGHFATPEQNKARAMPNELALQTPTLPRFLKQSGYRTIHIGKWHLGNPKPNVDALQEYGFDETYLFNRDRNIPSDGQGPSRPDSSRIFVDDAIQAISAVKDQPFYAQVWFFDTHAPLIPPAELREPYRNKRFTPDGFTTPYEVFSAALTEFDRQIGRLLKFLEDSGLADNTIVIFSSDNGPEDIEIANAAWSGVGNTGPLRGRKRSLYEGGVRLPFIVRWNGNIPAGQVNNHSVISGADLLPTLTSIAGIELPDDVKKTLRGENITDALKGNKQFTRSKPLYWEWRFRIANHLWNRSPILAIRDGQWKLLLNPDQSRIELYDIPNDHSEQNNVAEKYPDIVKKLSEKILAWQKTLPEGPYEPTAGKNDYPFPKEK